VERWNIGFNILKNQYSSIPTFHQMRDSKNGRSSKKLIPVVKGGGVDTHYLYCWKIG
jgi:hypothetical protein